MRAVVYLHLPVKGLIAHNNSGLLEVFAKLVQASHAAHNAALLELGDRCEILKRHAPGPLVHLRMYVCMYVYI